MKKYIVFTFIISIVLGFSCLTEATLIGSFDDSGSGGTVGVSTSMDVDFLYGDPGSPSAVIFDSFTFTTLDIGNEFFSTASNDSGFNNFAQYLTDGTDQTLWSKESIRPGFYGASGSLESGWFGTSPDFQGYTITKFGLIINDLSIDSPGSDPNGDGSWTDWSFDVTLNVYGSSAPVPEPGTIFLLGSGLIGLVGFKRKFRRG